MTAAQIILLFVLAYAAIGLLVGAAFVSFGVAAVDPNARATSPAFRVVILPGAAALWPVVMRKWLAARRKGARHDAH